MSDVDRIILAVEKAGHTAAELTALTLSEVINLDLEQFAATQRKWFRETMQENLPDLHAPPDAHDMLLSRAVAAFDSRLAEVMATAGQEGTA